MPAYQIGPVDVANQDAADTQPDITSQDTQLDITSQETQPLALEEKQKSVRADSNRSKRKLDDDSASARTSGSSFKQPVAMPMVNPEEKEPQPKRKKMASQLADKPNLANIPTKKQSKEDHVKKMDNTRDTSLNGTLDHNRTRYRSQHNISRMLNDSTARATVKNLMRSEPSFSQASQNKSLPLKVICFKMPCVFA